MSKKEKVGKKPKKGILGTLLSIILFPFKMLFKFFVWLVKFIFKLIITAPLRMASGLLIFIAFIALIIWLI